MRIDAPPIAVAAVVGTYHLASAISNSLTSVLVVLGIIALELVFFPALGVVYLLSAAKRPPDGQKG